MKKHLYLPALAMMVSAAALSLTGCEKTKTEPVPDPVLEITTENNMPVAATAATASIEYSLSNPVEGGKLMASSDASWVKDWDTETLGKVSFSVEDNTAYGSRSAVITLTYEYGAAQPLTDQITVVQSASSVVPELKVTTSAEDLTAGAVGESLTVGYTLDPDVEGTMTATSEAVWIKDYTYSDGAVTFTVEANDTYSQRSAVVKLLFDYGTDTPVTADVTVNQEAALRPVFTLAGDALVEGKISVAAEGQTGITLTATVTNPATNGVLSASADQEWISNIKTEGSTITFDVLANDVEESRPATLTVTYTYGSETPVTKTVQIEQAAAEPAKPDYEIEISSCYYMQCDFDDNITLLLNFMQNPNYTIVLKQNSGWYMGLSVEEKYGYSVPAFAAGTYEYVNGMPSAMQFGTTSKISVDSETVGITSGTCVVGEKAADGTIKIEINVTDANNKTHHVTFNSTIQSMN